MGKLYAAQTDDGLWHRVEVVDVKGIYITCFFIDVGERALVLMKDLKELDHSFLRLAPQAISVKLSGLFGHFEASERFATPNWMNKISYLKNSFRCRVLFQEMENFILHKSLIGEVCHREDDDITLILHDSSTNVAVNVNKQLYELLDIPPLEALQLSSPDDSETSDLDDAGLGDDLAYIKELVAQRPPSPGNFLDVNVASAASPSNFIVRQRKAFLGQS